MTRTRLTERIENFNNAFLLLKKSNAKYVTDKTDDIYKLALIQSFEITFELGWKVLKDYLFSKDIEVFTPRDVIKSAFSINILPSAQIWIDMAKDRNASAHEYNQDKVDKIIEKISGEYFQELCRFQKGLFDFDE